MELGEDQKVKWNKRMEKVEPKGLRLWLFVGTVTLKKEINAVAYKI